jgi:hypothetical protein
MGSIIMKKELVLVKDLHGYWSCALCVTCTEGKNITDSETAIKIIQEEYPDFKSAKFVQEENDIFALISNEIEIINHGNRCK